MENTDDSFLSHQENSTPVVELNEEESSGLPTRTPSPGNTAPIEISAFDTESLTDEASDRSSHGSQESTSTPNNKATGTSECSTTCRLATTAEITPAEGGDETLTPVMVSVFPEMQHYGPYHNLPTEEPPSSVMWTDMCNVGRQAVNPPPAPPSVAGNTNENVQQRTPASLTALARASILDTSSPAHNTTYNKIYTGLLENLTTSKATTDEEHEPSTGAGSSTGTDSADFQRKIKELSETDVTDPASREKAIHLLEDWRKEQVERIQTDMNILFSIEDMLKNINEENFKTHFDALFRRN